MHTILIVDDNAGFRVQARAVLEADGFHGRRRGGRRRRPASPPPAPLRPELVLLDIGLPDVEGFEVAQALAVDGPPPFVVLTSSREASEYGPRLATSRVLGFIAEGRAVRGRPSSPWSAGAVTLRVVLADDSTLLREGIARLLAEAGFDVVAQVGDADGLLAAVREQRPDVAIVDIRMPPTHTDEGLRAAEAIRDEHGTAVGVLVLSQYVETTLALRLVSDGSGGVGYLLKDRVDDLDEFADAVRRIAKGGSVIDPGGRRPAGRPAPDAACRWTTSRSASARSSR